MKGLFHEAAVGQGKQERSSTPSSALTTPAPVLCPPSALPLLLLTGRLLTAPLGFCSVAQGISESLMYSENADTCLVNAFWIEKLGEVVLNVSLLSAHMQGFYCSVLDVSLPESPGI